MAIGFAGPSVDLVTGRVSAHPGAFDISATQPVAVSSASFELTSVSPESIATIFGVQLATQTASGSDTDPVTPGFQLPTVLGGTTVEINNRRAELLYVSPGQINCVVPAATEEGQATLVVRSADGTVSSGTVQITRVAPSVFTANSNGSGVCAAQILRVRSDGSQSVEYPFEYNQTLQRNVSKPINLGPAGERVILVLFGTSLRRAPDPNNDGNVNESLRVLIGGVEVMPGYAGRQPDYVGLDQINVEIPRSLAGRGVVNVSVSATGYGASNLSEIEIASQSGATPPQVSGFGAPSALAGQQLVINGTGFSAVAVDNQVRISGLNAEVINATTNQLTVMVPFGAATGTVSVRTLQGEGVSSNMLPVRTSISGVVENTLRLPISGVSVRLSNTNITATTNSDGAFVLADVPVGSQFVEIDGASLQIDPPYPKVTLKIVAQANRDNQFTRTISIQQNTGSGGNVGSGSQSQAAPPDDLQQTALAAEKQVLTIKTRDYILEVPDNSTALFPTGATRGQIVLTPVENARTPIDLPLGYFSSGIVQITPFNVKLAPGAKLTLPNTEGLPAGSRAILFRYDQDQGEFVRDSAVATVSPDGSRIETEPQAIKVTSLYFAAVYRDTTTITGRVLDSDGKTPVTGAIARFRGQDAKTDGNGSYVLRFIPVKAGENVSADISYARPGGKVTRVSTQTVPAVPGGITRLPDVILPAEPMPKPLTVLAPNNLEIDEGKLYDYRFLVTGSSPSSIGSVTVAGANFAAVVNFSTQINPFILRLSPGYQDSGNYKLTIAATSITGQVTRQDISVVVNNVNQLPNISDINLTTNEDEPLTFQLPPNDLDGDKLSYVVIAPPSNGTLATPFPLVTYTPSPNFNGQDSFKVRANDGKADGNVATVFITVRPVNDPPVLSVPGSQTVNEGVQLRFTVTASDPDTGQTLTIAEASQLPRGASFKQTAATSGEFIWTPAFNQAGVYTISFRVTDNGTPQLSDTRTVQITVIDVPGIGLMNGRQGAVTRTGN